MSNERYSHNRDIVFEQLGINPNNRNYNCHHIVFKSDVKYGRVSKNFDLNDTSNLLPLETWEHEVLHQYIDNHPQYKNDISKRIEIANIVFNSDYELLPDFYRYCDRKVKPVKQEKKKKSKEKVHSKNRVKLESIYIFDPLLIDADIQMRRSYK